jgi:NTP pyrophosphatase (non-canonical NTP hydrolase)
MASFDEFQQMARESRALYRVLEQRRYGKEWTVADLFTGMVGDVGDLAQLLGAHAGVRPGPDDLHDQIGHELADILWSVLVIADELGIDVGQAFADLHATLIARITAKLAELG